MKTDNEKPLNPGNNKTDVNGATPTSPEFLAFMRVLRRALLMIVRWIELTYPEMK